MRDEERTGALPWSPAASPSRTEAPRVPPSSRLARLSAFLPSAHSSNSRAPLGPQACVHPLYSTTSKLPRPLTKEHSSGGSPPLRVLPDDSQPPLRRGRSHVTLLANEVWAEVTPTREPPSAVLLCWSHLRPGWCVGEGVLGSGWREPLPTQGEVSLNKNQLLSFRGRDVRVSVLLSDSFSCPSSI